MSSRSSPRLSAEFPNLSLRSPRLRGTTTQGAGCFGWPPKSRASAGGSQGRMPGLLRTAFSISTQCLSPKPTRLSLSVPDWPLPGVTLDQAASPPAPRLLSCTWQEQRSRIARLHAWIHPAGTDPPRAPALIFLCIGVLPAPAPPPQAPSHHPRDLPATSHRSPEHGASGSRLLLLQRRRVCVWTRCFLALPWRFAAVAAGFRAGPCAGRGR